MFSSHRIPARNLGAALLVLTAILLAGCAGSPTMLSSASPNAAMITNLFWGLFAVAIAIFLVVEFLLIYSVIRFRRKSPDEMPAQVHGNAKMEIAWTVAPAIILIGVFIFTWQTLNALAATPPGPVVNIKVIGKQWWWEVEYPELGVITANEIHLPVNQSAKFSLEARDVIHSFWVPELGGKMDLIPGKVNQMWFRPTQTGTYHGQCAEFCGVGHANMRLTVVVESADQFAAWTNQQKANAAEPTSDAALQGRQELEKSACIGCHTIAGTKAVGKIGPNLTHMSSRKAIAGGTIPLTRENLRAWISDPQGMKPGVLMPKVPLTPQQLDAIVSYLEALK